MPLTKPRFAQIDTAYTAVGDPITVLNQGSSTANVDVGFLFNRSNGLASNVALYWSESGNTFVTAFTNNTGVSNSNISVQTYANVSVGNVFVSGKQAVNGPAFYAYANSTTQTIATGVQTKVLFQVEEYDTNNCFASSRFTPTVEGYYQLNSAVRIEGTSGTGEMMLVIWKNGAEYKRGTNQSGTQIASNFWTVQVSGMVYANGTTDYFEIYVQHGADNDRNLTTVNSKNITWFDGCMIRGA